MNIEKYQMDSIRTMKFDDTVTVHCCLGLAGETGEVIDIIKKAEFYKKELNKDKVAEELGDVMFYLVNLATSLNLSMVNILEDNIVKLRKRFPDGFSEEDAIRRADVNDQNS